MTYTTNYNLNIVEGTDIVNPLTQLNPNFTAVDGIMKNNADATVTPATCIKSGTIHTVTRTNTDAEMFVFTATGDWNTGDTMTVDGTPVTPVLPDGTALLAGSYLINAEVLASIKGSKVTIYSNKFNIAAEIVDNLTSTATDKALSANQGKVLGDKLTVTQTLGRTASGTKYSVSYNEYTYGRMSMVYVSVTPLSNVTADYAEEIQLDLSHLPIDICCGANYASISASDRTPKVYTFLGNTGKITIGGQATLNRNFGVTFTYINQS